MNAMHTEPIPTLNMSFSRQPKLEAEVNELVTHYPEKRAASLMVLHAIQEQFGWISQEAVEWTAKKLELQPINVYELLTFYPMLRQEPMGKYQIKVCRTLSCALGGAYELREHFCEKFGLDAHAHGAQTTKDGKFTVEFVECLASCGTAPVMMCNDDFYEGVSHAKGGRDCGGLQMTMMKWLPDMDLNHDKQIQSLLCYRYTIGQDGQH